MYKAKDITGQRFGRLIAVERAEVKCGSSYWRCQCDCGRERTERLNRLRNGEVTSCKVCKCRPKRQRHTHTPEYNSWRSMIQRCTNSNTWNWENYGGRGIKVCDRWRDFKAFYEDTGPRPPGTTLDRIDNDKDYEPGNCRWATPSQQTGNQRKNHKVILYRGKEVCLTEAVKIAGSVVGYRAAYMRLQHGWPVDLAIETPTWELPSPQARARAVREVTA